jgi:hypothetical protein
MVEGRKEEDVKKLFATATEQGEYGYVETIYEYNKVNKL